MEINLRKIKKILKKEKIAIKKRLGQHFLIDQKIVNDMVCAADLKKNDCVLEVGPGLGILTEAIAKKVFKVVALEKDEKLVLYLQKKFKDCKNVKIILGDILKMKMVIEKEFNLPSYKIVANLPFYLTSRFLRLYLEPGREKGSIFGLTQFKFSRPNLMVLLIQKEVAKRIIAKPGDMSLLSISCQLYGEPKVIRFVSSESFFPSPDVDCAILKIKVLEKPRYKIDDTKLFFRIVKAGFAGKRKQLHNTLSAGLAIPNEKIKKILEKSQIDPTRRPQTLSLDEWLKLYNLLKLKTK